MIDRLTQTGGKLYPRAIEASVEGHLRQRRAAETPSRHSDVTKPMPAGKQTASQFAGTPASMFEPGQSAAQFRDLVEQMNQALIQARQKPARERPSASLTSFTGQRANHSYLGGDRTSTIQLLDELA